VFVIVCLCFCFCLCELVQTLASVSMGFRLYVACVCVSVLAFVTSHTLLCGTFEILAISHAFESRIYTVKNAYTSHDAHAHCVDLLIFCLYICMCVRMYVYMYVCVYVRMCVCVYICMCHKNLSLYPAYVCMHVFVCLCIVYLRIGVCVCACTL
jgi:hypothetical protein